MPRRKLPPPTSIPTADDTPTERHDIDSIARIVRVQDEHTAKLALLEANQRVGLAGLSRIEMKVEDVPVMRTEIAAAFDRLATHQGALLDVAEREDKRRDRAEQRELDDRAARKLRDDAAREREEAAEREASVWYRAFLAKVRTKETAYALIALGSAIAAALGWIEAAS